MQFKMNDIDISKGKDWKILFELERLIGRSIPQITKINSDSLGVVFEGENIVGLGLYNCLSTFPECITQLRFLKELYIGGNQLRTLPESFIKLKNLKVLDLGRNKLTNLPDSIFKLKSLLRLCLDGNNLTILPESIGELHSLERLSIINNGLKTLPDTVKNLSHLKDLDLSYNQLSTIPRSISNLSSLQELCLLNNELTELPTSIENLKSLKRLDLRHNYLSLLPDSIGKLVALQELDLRYNQLISIPESIISLSNLKYLYLDNNYLRVLPITITSLNSLEILGVSSNKLTFLPDSIGKMISMQEIDLRLNKLKNLPDSLGNLQSLKFLYLDHNHLTTLPDSITNLISLQSLRLKGNRLTNLPKSIDNLKLMQEIDLRYNQLTVLPKSIKNLPLLQIICLDDNQRNKIKFIKKQKSQIKDDLKRFEIDLGEFIIVELKKYFQEEWWEKGLPIDIKFYIQNKIETKKLEFPQIEPVIKESLDLKHYFSILSKNDNWGKIFSNIFYNKERLKEKFEDLIKFKSNFQENDFPIEDLQNHHFFIYDIIQSFSENFNIFISYSPADSEYFLTSELASHLESYPEINKVFLGDIINTAPFKKYLNQFIKISNFFILFCSEKFPTSSGVRDEWKVAFRLSEKNKITIISVYEEEYYIPRLLKEMPKLKIIKGDFNRFLETLYKKIIEEKKNMQLQVNI